jgi:hypothetical protein
MDSVPSHLKVSDRHQCRIFENFPQTLKEVAYADTGSYTQVSKTTLGNWHFTTLSTQSRMCMVSRHYMPGMAYCMQEVRIVDPIRRNVHSSSTLSTGGMRSYREARSFTWSRSRPVTYHSHIPQHPAYKRQRTLLQWLHTAGTKRATCWRTSTRMYSLQCALQTWSNSKRTSREVVRRLHTQKRWWVTVTS